MGILQRDFYLRDTRKVAIDLLGKVIYRRINNIIIRSKIVEVEAYLGPEDVASHARFGETKRNYLMFEDGGKVYIYLIYGMYFCLNFTTDVKGNAGGVLIRAVEPLDNVDILKANRGIQNLYDLTNGPGKLCQAFKIGQELCGSLICEEKNELCLVDEEFTYNSKDIVKSFRIGNKKDLKEELRFYIKDNKFVSRGI